MAWNIDEQLKITPFAAKFHELITSICAPTATTAASLVNTCMKSVGLELAEHGQQRHERSR